jgi:xanthine dehydrogenase YagR molybdenum-binding subunit
MGTSKRNALEPVLGRWHSQNLAVVALPVNADIPAEIDASLSMRSTTTPGR